ncbi:MAG: 30S ribosomal protein S20 [Erysipelotrichaceae bacterium]
MPNIKSQIKRAKTNVKAHDQNQSAKSEIKTVIKEVLSLVAASDKANAQVAYNKFARLIDKAVNNNVYHVNYANRQKARLSTAINKIA